MEPRTNNFGARLRSLIDRKGLTLVEFAEQFPLSESNLHNWLKRSGPPLEKHWSKLAQFFGVSEAYIAYGTPQISEPPASHIVGEGATDELKEFSWRIKSAAHMAQLSQEVIAGQLGVPVSRVADWFQGKKRPRAREMRDLATVLLVNDEWLATGEGSREMPPQPEGIALTDLPGSAAGAVFVREVPVISWTHAGAAATYDEMPQHFHGKVATSSRGRRVYGLRVEGDSMIPRYNPGDVVILDADGEPRNGKGVVVKFANDSVQIRLYHKLSNGKIRLTSTRPEIYPTDDYDPADFHWIHPVLQTVRDE